VNGEGRIVMLWKRLNFVFNLIKAPLLEYPDEIPIKAIDDIGVYPVNSVRMVFLSEFVESPGIFIVLSRKEATIHTEILLEAFYNARQPTKPPSLESLLRATGLIY